MTNNKYAMRITAAAVVAGGVFLAPVASGASTSVPFTDPSAQGLIGLCGRNDKPVTSGSLTDQPFVWKAVSTAAAPAHYTLAFLAVYQPIQHVEPSAWTGTQLTLTSSFTNAQHPAVQTTNADDPLVGEVQSYPPYWNGLYQLRMFFAGPKMSPYTTSYPAAVIQVQGNSWHLIQGGTVDCAASQGVSTAVGEFPAAALQSPRTVVVDPHPATPTTTESPNSKGSSSSSSATSTMGPLGASSSATGSGRESLSASGREAAPSSGSGSSAGWIAAGVAVVLAGAVGAGVWWRRRWSRPSST